MKKEIIRNGILTSLIGVAVLTLSTCDKEEEVPVESHSYDDYISKYDKNLIRTGELINHGEAFIMEGKRIKFAEEKTIKLKKVLNAERIERARIAKEKREAELTKLKEQRKKNEIVKSNKSSDSNDGNWTTYQATYYTATCNGCTGITASGINVKNSIYHNGLRVVAVDTRLIPLGSIIEVKTHYGTFKAIAGDKGNAIKGKILDILVSSKSEARKLGRHNVEVRIVK